MHSIRYRRLYIFSCLRYNFGDTSAMMEVLQCRTEDSFTQFMNCVVDKFIKDLNEDQDEMSFDNFDRTFTAKYSQMDLTGFFEIEYTLYHKKVNFFRTADVIFEAIGDNSNISFQVAVNSDTYTLHCNIYLLNYEWQGKIQVRFCNGLVEKKFKICQKSSKVGRISSIELTSWEIKRMIDIEVKIPHLGPLQSVKDNLIGEITNKIKPVVEAHIIKTLKKLDPIEELIEPVSPDVDLLVYNSF